jgi:hypothetical protein
MDSIVIPPVVLQLSGVAGAFWAIWTFRRTATTRRAEWLSTLYAKFYEGTTYKHIRSVLDYDIERDLTNLRTAITTGQHGGSTG